MVFDVPFVGGSAMGGLCPNGTGAQVKCAQLINITYGVRRHAGYYSRSSQHTHVSSFRQSFDQQRGT